MGAAGDLRSDQSGLSVEHVGVDPLQIVPALVVVAVAGGGGEMGGVDPVFLHGGQHLALVVLCRLVDGVKSGAQVPQNGLAVFIDSPADAQLFVHRFNFHDKTSFFRFFCTIGYYNSLAAGWQEKRQKNAARICVPRLIDNT